MTLVSIWLLISILCVGPFYWLARRRGNKGNDGTFWGCLLVVCVLWPFGIPSFCYTLYGERKGWW